MREMYTQRTKYSKRLHYQAKTYIIPFLFEDLLLYRCRPVKLPLPFGKAAAAVR